MAVLKECATMKPQDPIPPLLAAKVCINQLHWVRETHKAHVHNIPIGPENKVNVSLINRNIILTDL